MQNINPIGNKGLYHISIASDSNSIQEKNEELIPLTSTKINLTETNIYAIAKAWSIDNEVRAKQLDCINLFIQSALKAKQDGVLFYPGSGSDISNAFLASSLNVNRYVLLDNDKDTFNKIQNFIEKAVGSCLIAEAEEIIFHAKNLLLKEDLVVGGFKFKTEGSERFVLMVKGNFKDFLNENPDFKYDVFFDKDSFDSDFSFGKEFYDRINSPGGFITNSGKSDFSQACWAANDLSPGTLKIEMLEDFMNGTTLLLKKETEDEKLITEGILFYKYAKENFEKNTEDLWDLDFKKCAEGIKKGLNIHFAFLKSKKIDTQDSIKKSCEFFTSLAKVYRLPEFGEEAVTAFQNPLKEWADEKYKEI